MAFTFFDIGACNCVSGLSCYPCRLPAGNLFVTFAAGANEGGTFETWGGSGTLVYTAGTPAIWTGPYTYTGYFSGTDSFTISCSPTCTYFENSAFFYDHPSACSGLSLSAWTLVSFSCSPLNIVFKNPGAVLPDFATWTITG